FSHFVASSILLYVLLLFFFQHPATTEIYTLSLHDALPISTGCCIHECVAIIRKPLAQEPRKTIKPERKCSFCPSSFSPKRNMPRKEDSKKKENIPSIANVCPMMPPVSSENLAQLVPN